MVKLDLNKFPVVTNARPWLRYDPFIQFPELLNMGDISDRLYGCYRFCIAETDEKYPNMCEKAHIRAAVNEFVSISEVVKIIYPQIAIEQTDYPLFHFLKELRNTNFHVKSFRAGANDMSIKLTAAAEEIYTITVFVIGDCNVELFTGNKNLKKYYNTDEFLEVIEWVCKHQYTWGFMDVVEFALKQYSALIHDTITKSGIKLEHTIESVASSLPRA